MTGWAKFGELNAGVKADVQGSVGNFRDSYSNCPPTKSR